MPLVVWPKKFKWKRYLMTRDFETKRRELSLVVKEIENLTSNVITHKSNFTQWEYSALHSLKGNQDIVCKTAGKEDGRVIKDKILSR